MIRPAMGIISQSNVEGATTKLPLVSEDEMKSIQCQLDTPVLYTPEEWAACVSRLVTLLHSAEGYIVNQQATIVRLHRLLRKWFVALH